MTPYEIIGPTVMAATGKSGMSFMASPFGWCGVWKRHSTGHGLASFLLGFPSARLQRACGQRIRLDALPVFLFLPAGSDNQREAASLIPIGGYR